MLDRFLRMPVGCRPIQDHATSIFLEITDNIYETVQDTDSCNGRLTEVVGLRGLSNGSNTNELEWPWRSLLMFGTFLTPIPREYSMYYQRYVYSHYCKPFQMCVLAKLCHSLQEFNWHSASRALSAIDELLVVTYRAETNNCWRFNAVNVQCTYPSKNFADHTVPASIRL